VRNLENLRRLANQNKIIIWKTNTKTSTRINQCLSLGGFLRLSSTLLLHLLANGYECTCVSFDYGQKHSVELERAKSLVDYLNHELRPQGYSTIIHQTIKIEGWSELLNSSLVQGGSEVPEGHYEESNMSQTVVENRNKVFSSIIPIYSISCCQ
jgi:7-cyano-7-deazaguanine synthase